ncbi:MAG: NTP transferase domain-containing protein [Gammaproteobacteria bacterium]|nr:NTP transferase domain-containing protein [Gammaproteobacteria bacterium]
MNQPALRGLVLAGGQSVRMGADKAALLIDGRTLLARSVALLSPLTTAVQVAIRPGQASDGLRRQFSLLIDEASVPGPAGALVAAWQHDPHAAWLVLACDMPALEHAALEVLVARRDPKRGATAWQSAADGLPEPLCAIWEPVTLARLAAVARQAGNGPVSPRAILAGADPLLLNPARPLALRSVNTPADLRRYLESNDGHKP